MESTLANKTRFACLCRLHVEIEMAAGNFMDTLYAPAPVDPGQTTEAILAVARSRPVGGEDFLPCTHWFLGQQQDPPLAPAEWGESINSVSKSLGSF
jgi:hypothetical protein